jgi:nucleoid-associated protein EbfC
MMKGQLGNMMQQAQKLQQGVQKAQQEIEDLVIDGQAGGGLVRVQMNGKYQVQHVTLDDELLEDREMLEDLLAAAFNDAGQKVRDATQEKLSAATGGLPLPPGLFG